MSSYALRAATVVCEAEDRHGAVLSIEDGRIAAVGEAGGHNRPIDLGDATIIPGMIDIHIHGRARRDVMDADPESLRVISASLARHGITGFLATTVTSGWQRTLDALSTVRASAEAQMPGARLLGAYSEGLFFNCTHKGAHNDAFFLPPTIERVDAMIEAAGGKLRVIALAPEIEGAMDVVRHAAAKGIKVVLGHTDASYDQARAALEAGASGGVHVFNGMRGIHHREPGCAGALLLERATVEVIADGAHLHPAILLLISRLKARDDILLISDCMCAGGLADGDYRLGETDVTVKDGIVRTGTGSLAGSTLTLDRAIVRMADEAGVPFRDAVHMASLSPARFLDLGDRLGSIAPGKAADLAILDADRRVRATIVGGELVYLDPEWPAAAALSASAGASGSHDSRAKETLIGEGQ